MVRFHGSVSSAKTTSRLERELAALFGLELFKRVKATDPADLDLSAELMDAVHDAADHLLGHAGDRCHAADRGYGSAGRRAAGAVHVAFRS